MFGFLIKKAFFDMWDNMFRILIMNLGYILVLAIFFLLAPLFTSIPALFVATLVVGIGVFALYTGVASRMCSEIADYKQPGFRTSRSSSRRATVPASSWRLHSARTCSSFRLPSSSTAD